ncbi:MAG TPA: histidine--tRNA ligase family protein, partial [Candidatus Aenigmarchaeota archaeon]|nr:histidine--tRNA ligase family protein [Candidatus Aenigmarchaeota archaeon]
EAFRAIDKLDKIGEEGVKDELAKRGIKKKSIEKIMEIIKMRGKCEVLDEVEKFIKDKVGKSGIDELRELLSYLDTFNVKERFFTIDFSLVRGLDYYTGPIYETVVTKPKIGSLTGGGRYDKLIGLFAGIEVPATGTTIGIERIIDVMNELGMLRGLKNTYTKVFVAYTSRDLIKECIKVANELRRSGIPSQIDLMGRNLDKQLKYADSIGIPFVIVVGKREIKEGMFTVRDMKKRKEIKVGKDDLVEFFSQFK